MAPVSKAKFEKAVEIIQNLPKDGPIKPSQEEQLSVRIMALIDRINHEYTLVLQIL